MPTIQNATLADYHSFVAQDVRPEDIREWEDAGEKPWRLSLRQAFALNAGVIRSLRLGEDCVAIWGVNPPYVWLIAAQPAVKAWRLLMRQFAAEVSLLHQHSPHLLAIADRRNTLHLAWLDHCGFLDVEVGERWITLERKAHDPVL